MQLQPEDSAPKPGEQTVDTSKIRKIHFSSKLLSITIYFNIENYRHFNDVKKGTDLHQIQQQPLKKMTQSDDYQEERVLYMFDQEYKQ